MCVRGFAIRVAFVGLVLTACIQPITQSPSERPRSEPAAATATASPLNTPGEARLPTVAGPPQPLDPGTYLTPEGFAPPVSITVPVGWYGGAGSTGFFVGQGLDEVNQRFADVGLYLDVVQLDYDAAIAAFREIEGVVIQAEPETGTIGGHEATTFEASTEGGQALLDPIAPGIDLTAAAYQQIFVDVGGTTVLIRTEVFNEAAQPALDGVLASIEFPDN
jgi:hypothetical protein